MFNDYAEDLRTAGERFARPEVLKALEWGKLIGAIKERCESEPGRLAAERLRFFVDPATVEFRLALVQDSRFASEQGRMPSLSDLQDALGCAAKAKKEGALDIEEIRRVSFLTNISQSFSALCSAAEESGEFAALRRYLAPMSPLKELYAAFHKTLDARGQIRDDASPRLKELRKRKRELQNRIKERIQEYLTRHELSEMLQENYYTVREERYVLPVATHYKRMVRGIIHGSSVTGQTVYIEPEELVGYNNDLKMIEAEEEQEIRRILRELSGKVKEFSGEIETNFLLLAEMDAINASARLSADLSSNAPTVVDPTESDDETFGFYFEKARHPLLALRGVKVVANDIRLGFDEYDTLVVSGPNTGGKTVALKTAGLLILMTQAGIPVPAGRDSRFTPYKQIWCDIGDDQSIDKDLSTFSANINNLNEALASAGKGTVALLDEIIVGTDPIQGSALAVAYLEEFNKRRAQVMLTTHYEQVKVAAQSSVGFSNAAVGLDSATGKPNYSLSIGVPGASSAFTVARELGVPDSVLARAQELTSGASRAFEETIKSLNVALAQAEEKKAALDAEIEKYKTEREAVKEKERQLKSTIAAANNEKIAGRRKAYLEAIDEMSALLAAAKKQETTRKEIEESIKQITAKERALPPPEEEKKAVKPPFDDPTTLTSAFKGLEVWVETLAKKGVVLEDQTKEGPVLVEIGKLQTRVQMKSLLASKAALEKKKKAEVKSYASVDRGAQEGGGLSLDLRGARVDEALTQLEGFLDRAFRRDLPVVDIIHGHGTGAIKKAVREYLMNCPYVASFEFAAQEGGGTGVTVVKLK